MIKEFRDRLILTELHRDEREVKVAFIIIGALLVILLAIVSYLFVLFFQSQKPIPNKNQTLQTETISTIPTATPTSSPTAIPTQPLTKAVNEPAIKDYFIPFGTGVSQAGDWTDVPGLQANIDFGNYQNIKEIHFEVSVNVPATSQSVSIRLFNVTDKHPVWYSEVTTNNNYVSSPAIIYDKGLKLYQVQMKTQLQSPANLTQARIHISLK